MKNSKTIWAVHYLFLVIACCITGLFYMVNRRNFLLSELFLCALVTMVTLLLWRRGKSYYPLFFLFAMGFLLRAFYIIYTPTWIRQHDVIGFGAGFGQAGLIEFFYKNQRLIDFDPRQLWGFFQPPLHHILAAVWLKCNVILGFSYNHACENVQVLTLFYSMITVIFAYKIFRQFELTGVALITATAIMAMHPVFIIMSGSINNDMLSIMFQVMAIYFVIKWSREPKWATILMIALTIGCSMMAKLSGALIAPATATVFLIRFAEACIHKEKKKISGFIGQFAAFGAVCIPLGLWSPLRNFLKFQVPVTYTPEVGEPLGMHGIFARIFQMRSASPFPAMIANGDSYDEFNIPLAFLKTSLFGEYNYANDVKMITPFAWVLLIAGGILFLISVVAMILCFTKNKNQISVSLRSFFAVYIISTIAFYVNLCFSAPNFSSQDFRYIAYLVVIEALFTGMMLQAETISGWQQVMKKGTIIVTLLFTISTIAVYLLLSLSVV